MPETRNQRMDRQARVAALLEKKRDALKAVAADNNFMIDHAINVLRSQNATDEAQTRMLDKATNFLKLHARDDVPATHKPNKPKPSEQYHRERRQQIDEGLNNLKQAGRHSLGLAGTLLRGGTALTSHLLLGGGGVVFKGIGTAVSTVAKGTWHGAAVAANSWSGFMSILGVGKIGRNLIAGSLIAGMGAYVTVPINANEHATLLGHTMAQAQLHQACLNPLVFNGDKVSAAFALAHGQHEPGIDMIYRASQRAGLLHGIAPDSPFYIAAYETNGFRDLAANNSSATNPWQMIDSTKFAYIKRYGQDTFAYKDAVERLNNGTSQDIDRDLMIRDSINAVVDASQNDIDTAIEQNRLPPLLFAAKNLANDMFFAAELVALDIHKNAPALHLANLDGVSAEERLTLTANYYAPDHFLGATNYRYVVRLASADPDIRVTNTAATDDIIGGSGARKLNAVVKANPGLLADNVTAGQMIPRITSYFSERISDVAAPVIQTANSASSAFDLCVTNKDELGIESGPIMASRAEIAFAVFTAAMPTDTLNSMFNTVQTGVTAVADTLLPAEPAPRPRQNDGIGSLILDIN